MEEGRNGRRSRGQSPNGHLSDDSSATDDSDHDNGMRVGRDYQAAIPEFNPGAKPDSKAEAMLVWAPHPDMAGSKVDEYVSVAKEKHGYNTEQALGMLFWHKHNIDKSLGDLPNFTPFPDEWTVEDKVLFEQAFSFHGKSFHRIRQMLPDKSIASLVKYYYSWKKTRSRTSLMDRQARKLAHDRTMSDEDEASGNSDSDFESLKESGQKEQHKNGIRQTVGSKKSDCHPRMKNKRKPPRGMYLVQDDLVALATGPPRQGEALLKQLDAELVSLKRQVQNNKQMIGLHKHKTMAGIDIYRPPQQPLRINPRWTNEELLLAVQGVRKYGKNFKAIAEVIGNKTEAHVRSFFVNYCRRYNLDEVLAEYEKEYGVDHTKDQEPDREQEMDVEVLECPPQNGEVLVSASVPSITGSSSSSSSSSALSSGSAAISTVGINSHGALPTITSSASAPPPLLKQPPSQLPPSSIQSSRQHLHPHLQQHRSLGGTTPGGRTILQQPPPLIRPTAVPLAAHSKHGGPPTLTSSQ